MSHFGRDGNELSLFGYDIFNVYHLNGLKFAKGDWVR